MTAKKVRFTGIIQARYADTSYEDGDEVEMNYEDHEENEDDDTDYMRACLITLGIMALVGVILAIAFFTVREVEG